MHFKKDEIKQLQSAILRILWRSDRPISTARLINLAKVDPGEEGYSIVSQALKGLVSKGWAKPVDQGYVYQAGGVSYGQRF